MLTGQQTHQPGRPHGCGPSLTELRTRLATPETLGDADRQHLSELSGRLARLRRLGGAFAAVQLSETAAAAIRTIAVGA